MITLQKNEKNIVSGGNFGNFIDDLGDRVRNLGRGRDIEGRCYNAAGQNVQGWKARDIDNLLWFCCDDRNFTSAVLGNIHATCANRGTKVKLNVTNPDNLKIGVGKIEEKYIDL